MLKRIVPHLFLGFMISCAVSQESWAGQIHDLLLNPKIGDEQVKAALLADDDAINEVVRYPDAAEKHWRRLSIEEQRFYDASVLAVAAKVGRFGLVCWMLEKYPHLDIRVPQHMLGGATLLEWVRQKDATQLGRILALRPEAAAPVANPIIQDEGLRHDLVVDDESFVAILVAVVMTTTFGSWWLG